jgi:pantoate kinase
VVVGSFGSISTSSILTHPVYRERIIKAGSEAMDGIRQHFDIQTYMTLCRRFIEHTDLLTLLGLDHVRDLMEELNQLEIIGASMNQLGQSVFCFCKESQVPRVEEIFERYQPTHVLKTLSICPHGPVINALTEVEN